MATQMYCFVSSGDVHCVPIEEDPTAVADSLANSTSNGNKNGNGSLTATASLKVPLQTRLIRNKNLIYSLNDPSLSDFESAGENDASTNEDDEDEDDVDKDENENESENGNGSHNGALASIKKTLYLPQFAIDLPTNLSNNFSQVKQLLTTVFPWILSPEEISVKELTGGITNMLLSCKHTPSGFTALMRVYGQGTNLIIDRHREFVLQLILNSLNLAPPIYARFSNGLIYGFLPGRSLQPEELQNEKLYPLIAQQLGIWHNKISGEDIDEGVEKLRKITMSLKKQHSGSDGRPSLSRLSSSKRRLLLLFGKSGGHGHPRKKSISFVWELIEDWMNIVPITPGLIESFLENDALRNCKTDVNADTTRSVVQAEFEWLRTELTENSRSPIVSCHCDLLSGNIIIPEDFLTNTTPVPPTTNPVQFIDYEYMLSGPRAFDIANHLAEWQGFDCDRSAILVPSKSNPVMRKWVEGYLNKPEPQESEVDEVIEEISMFYGMPGFYWGVWAMIQSEISTIDFDYANYGKLRFQEYWDWKKDYLSKKKNEKNTA